MNETNGHKPNGLPRAVDLDELEELAAREQEELVARDRERVAAREPATQIQETLAPSAMPFDQKAHDLMIRGIDQVATDWVGELAHTRENSQRVEQLVMERAAKVKADITGLYLLGAAALAEAKRGDEVNHRLATELDKLAGERG